jgi:hypothetical protein
MAEQQKYKRPGARRFSGSVEMNVSADPSREHYAVTLSTPVAVESALIHASEVAPIENAAERYDRLAAMALAGSQNMRVHAAWAGGPSAPRTWDDYVIERLPSPRRGRGPQRQPLDASMGGLLEERGLVAGRGDREGPGNLTDGWRWSRKAGILQVKGLPCASGTFEGWASYRDGTPIAWEADVLPAALAYAHAEAPHIPADGLSHAHRDVGVVRVVLKHAEGVWRAHLPVSEQQRIGIATPTKRFFGVSAEAAARKVEGWLLTEKGIACRLVLEGDLPRDSPTIGMGRTLRDPPVEVETREEHLLDLVARVQRRETGSTEAIMEMMARDYATPVIFLAYLGPTPVEPKAREGGYGLWAITVEEWVAIRPDGWPVLAPGPDGSVDTWVTKAAVQAAIDAVNDAERTRR